MTDKKTIHLRMAADEHKMLEAVAFLAGKSMNAVLMEWVRPRLEQEGQAVRELAVAINAARKASNDV